jgi:hypothetical protein
MKIRSGLALIAMAGLAAATPSQAQISIVNNIPGTFIDISPAGNGLGIDSGVHADDAAAAIPVNIGNIILPAGNMFVGSNGMGATATGITTFSNATLTAASVRGYYPYWDDLRTDNTTSTPPGTIYYANLPGVTVIQWNNVVQFGNPAPGNEGTFELQIFDGSSGILAQMFYPDVTFGTAGLNNGSSATIGAVADAANGFALWSFNTASIQDGSVLTIVPAPASLALLGLGGLIAGRRRR